MNLNFTALQSRANKGKYMKHCSTQMKSKRRISGIGRLFAAAAIVLSCGLSAQTTFNYTGALQTYTVPVGVTSIRIEARGAQGGSVTVACAATGGLGAQMVGDFSVTPGEVLTVLVGGQGQTNGEDGGGGGGSFVVRTGNVPLIVAGGGGGASNNIQICAGNRNGVNASITTSGTASANGLVAGGSPGNGGGANVGSGGGGGGFNTDGVGGSGNVNGRGRAFVNGGAGGTGIAGDHGGFGGGGSGWFYGGNGGGGGGYAGGGTDGNYPSTYFGGGGGGGSFNAGTNQVNTAGVQTGNGLVVITLLYSASVAQTQAISCNGGSNGSLTATPNGGTSPYSYSWAPSGGTSATATGLTAGTYTVTITDATSATTSATFTLTEPTALSATASSTPLSCNGGNNGSATATVSGGSPGYTYMWSNGGVTPTIVNISSGVYTYTVTDVQGCTSTASVNVTQPSAIVAGTSGGTPGYTYMWSTGGTSTSISNLAAGVYTYTVTDVNGCTSTSSSTVIEPAVLSGSFTSSAVLCNGGMSTITLSATGGTTPYIGDSTFQVMAGSYSYVITDDNGCTSSVSVTVTEPAAISVNATTVDVSCFGDSTGSIDLTVTGGTAPFSFSWNNGAFTTEDLTNIPAGSYSGILTDANGCQDSGTVVVSQPLAPLSISVASTNPTTCSGSNGMIDATISGGTPAYTYVWSNGPTTEDNNNLPAGTYTLTVTDTAGCTETAEVTLIDPAAPAVSLAIPADTICNTDAPLTLTGGTPAGGVYSGTAITTGVFNPLTAPAGSNTITYTYTDSQTGCVGSSTDVIFVDPCAGVNEINNDEITFNVFPNPNNGTFTVQNSSVNAGDIAVYDAQGRVLQTVRLNGGAQSQLTIDVAGIYMIRMIDANGNASVQQVIVE
jgi:hypothetical protein